MSPDLVYNALASLVSLAIGCYLYFWRFRSYRVDLFRQRMFELRAELFDDADAGLIDFNHPAYGMLRSMMNGYIRFAHRLNLWLIIALVVLTAGLDVPTERSWTDATSKLDPAVQERLNHYRSRMARLAMQHAMIVSPEAHLVAIPLVVAALIILMTRHGLAHTKPTDGTSPAVPTSALSQVGTSVATTIDDTAFVYGQGELQAA